MAREFIDIRAPHSMRYGAEQAAAAQLKRQQVSSGTKTTAAQQRAARHN